MIAKGTLGAPLVVLAINSAQEAVAAWTYANQAGWGNTCVGNRVMSQSPIDLTTSLTNNYGSFTFNDYTSDPATQKIENDGHTVKISFTSPSPSISGGGLNATYNYLQHHFHWGRSDSEGSEHTVGGTAHPLELHIVHVKDGLSVEDALTTWNGLAVLGILYDIDNSDNSDLAPIITEVANIEAAEASVTTSSLPNLSELLPSDTSGFFRYFGSLTTPTCNEAVVWTVFKDTQTISSAQLATFRTINDVDGEDITYNFRDIQSSTFSGLKKTP